MGAGTWVLEINQEAPEQAHQKPQLACSLVAMPFRFESVARARTYCTRTTLRLWLWQSNSLRFRALESWGLQLNQIGSIFAALTSSCQLADACWTATLTLNS